jgi:hypothetical protein
MNFTVGVILIQIVYGDVYRNTWGANLSDKWPGERPNYITFGIITGLFAAAAPQEGMSKLGIVAVVILGLLVVPGYLFIRKMSAYVLIRVRPGETENVQRYIEDQNIPASSLYGSYDLISMIEVLRLPAKRDSLSELTNKVRGAIRSISGMTHTETLIDFSQMVRFRRTVHGDTRDAPERR